MNNSVLIKNLIFRNKKCAFILYAYNERLLTSDYAKQQEYFSNIQ